MGVGINQSSTADGYSRFIISEAKPWGYGKGAQVLYLYAAISVAHLEVPKLSGVSSVPFTVHTERITRKPYYTENPFSNKTVTAKSFPRTVNIFSPCYSTSASAERRFLTFIFCPIKKVEGLNKRHTIHSIFNPYNVEVWGWTYVANEIHITVWGRGSPALRTASVFCRSERGSSVAWRDI